jgi:hypothetical protein
MPWWAWVLLFVIGPVILWLAAIGAIIVHMIWSSFKGWMW